MGAHRRRSRSARRPRGGAPREGAALGRRRRAGRAAQQPRPAGGVRGARHGRGRSRAGRAAAQPALRAAPRARRAPLQVRAGAFLQHLVLVTMPLATEVEQRRFARDAAARHPRGAAAGVRHAQGLGRRGRRGGVASLHAPGAARRGRRGGARARAWRKAGNWSTLRAGPRAGLLRRRRAGRSRARSRPRSSTREQLTRLLGLWGSQAAALALPERLPDLPASGAGAAGHRARGDGAAARRARGRPRHAGRRVATSASRKATRFINVLEVGVQPRAGGARRAVGERLRDRDRDCRSSTGARRASRAPRRVYMPVGSTARRRPRSTRAPRSARPTAATA